MSESYKPLPPDTAALITYLDEMYPERSPDPTHPEREIWMRAGERRLVRHLIAKHAADHEDLTENNLNVFSKHS